MMNHREERTEGTVTALLVLLGAVICATISALVMTGCQPVGPKASITRDSTELASTSPVTLQIEDADKKGVASGIGPARYTSITGDEVQTFQTGTTPRDLWLELRPDGTRKLNLSSGTDIQIEGLTVDPESGAIAVAKFGTSSSDPIRAGNEAYDRLVAYWTSLSEAQKEARLAEIDALKVTAPEIAEFILKTISGL